MLVDYLVLEFVTWRQRWDGTLLITRHTFSPRYPCREAAIRCVHGRHWKTYKDDKVKAAAFLHIAGPEALEEFNTLAFDNPGYEKKLDMLVEKFEAYCIPRKNVMWERLMCPGVN